MCAWDKCDRDSFRDRICLGTTADWGAGLLSDLSDVNSDEHEGGNDIYKDLLHCQARHQDIARDSVRLNKVSEQVQQSYGNFHLQHHAMNRNGEPSGAPDTSQVNPRFCTGKMAA